MDQQQYDLLFQNWTFIIGELIRKKGIKTANELKECVKKNINMLDIRLARMVMVNNQVFGAFLDDTYESVGLATDIVIDE